MRRLSRSQLREIDRRSIADYHLPGIVLMENAARGAADVARAMLPAVPSDVALLCGGGNNGGDGLAIARHLHNAGHRVKICFTIDPETLAGDALTNWRICRAMNLPAGPFSPADLSASALIVDAVFGTGLSRPPRDPFGEVVRAVSAAAAVPVLAVDVPSGLDCDSGRPPGACIVATKTATFVAEKIGFTAPDARRYLGEIVVLPIGCPVELINAV